LGIITGCALSDSNPDDARQLVQLKARAETPEERIAQANRDT
jgi:hypothetical protein